MREIQTFDYRIKRLKELESEIAQPPWDYASNDEWDDQYWLFFGDEQVESGEYGSVLSRYRETLYSPDEGFDFGDHAETKKHLEYISHARMVIPQLIQQLAALAQERDTLAWGIKHLYVNWENDIDGAISYREGFQRGFEDEYGYRSPEIDEEIEMYKKLKHALAATAGASGEGA
jgi:hypothetical protein